MKFLILFLILLFPISLQAKTNLTATEFMESIKINSKFNENCDSSNHSVLESDKILKININLQLNNFSGLTIDDFDMGECLSESNVDKDIFITHFWQKNKKFKGQNLSVYLAYKPSAHRLLIAIIDDDLNVYLIGDKDADLRKVINLYSAQLLNTEGVDTNSTLSYSDFNKKDEDHKYKYSKEIDAVLYPEWTYSCSRDRFDNSKSCYMHNNDIGILLLNGYYAISVGRDHYPRSKASLKIDNNPTLNAVEGLFSQNAMAIINQFKKGQVAYTRYYEWPYQYSKKDRESKLNGFTKTFNEMLETYKKL